MPSPHQGSPSDLTPAELSFLRARLERLRDDLVMQVRRSRAATQASSEPAIEPMDAAEQTREQDDAILLGERERALLREIEHALAKFEAGSYGLSEASGEPIGFRRLEAIPWARVASDEIPGMPRRA